MEEGHNVENGTADDSAVDNEQGDTLGSAIDQFQSKKGKKIGRRNTAPAKTEVGRGAQCKYNLNHDVSAGTRDNQDAFTEEEGFDKPKYRTRS